MKHLSCKYKWNELVGRLNTVKLSDPKLVALTKEPVVICRLSFHHTLYCNYVAYVAVPVCLSVCTDLIITDTFVLDTQHAVSAYPVEKVLAKVTVTNWAITCETLFGFSHKRTEYSDVRWSRWQKVKKLEWTATWPVHCTTCYQGGRMTGDEMGCACNTRWKLGITHKSMAGENIYIYIYEVKM